ncbi:MAG: hypothetical protein ACE14M_15160 [Terriglobales bacterium]
MRSSPFLREFREELLTTDEAEAEGDSQVEEAPAQAGAAAAGK